MCLGDVLVPGAVFAPSEQGRAVSGVFIDRPMVDGGAVGVKVGKSCGKAAADGRFRDVMSALFDALGDAQDGIVGVRQADEIEADVVTQGLPHRDLPQVASAGKCGF